MPSSLSLVPAYGRDYPSKVAVLAAFVSDKAFLIADLRHPYSGKLVNRPQVEGEGITSVRVRYGKLQKQLVLVRFEDSWRAE